MKKDLGAKNLFYPQPVAIIGTWNEDGTPNAMNAAWGGTADYDKIFLAIEGHRTNENLSRLGEFTVAFADAAHLVAADYVGIVSGRDVPDKVARAGLTAENGHFVSAPVFREFPITLECRLVETNEYGIIGQVVNAAVDEEILDGEGRVDPDQLSLITFDPSTMAYVLLGKKVGQAFADGKALE